MGTFTFITGTMSSGKTTHLLQTHFNIESAFPGQVMLLNKNDRSGESVCSNRTGGASLSTGLTDDSSLVDIITNEEQRTRTTISHVFIDEAQFLTEDQVESLAYLVDVHDINVYAYGLMTSYKGKLFDATIRILELCDRVIQVSNGMRCWCGKRATHNALFVAGAKASSGATTIVDNSDMIDYQVMCRRHFLEHIENTSKP